MEYHPWGMFEIQLQYAHCIHGIPSLRNVPDPATKCLPYIILYTWNTIPEECSRSNYEMLTVYMEYHPWGMFKIQLRNAHRVHGIPSLRNVQDPTTKCSPYTWNTIPEECSVTVALYPRQGGTDYFGFLNLFILLSTPLKVKQMPSQPRRREWSKCKVSNNSEPFHTTRSSTLFIFQYKFYKLHKFAHF